MNTGRKLEISTTVYIIMYVEFIDEETVTQKGAMDGILGWYLKWADLGKGTQESEKENRGQQEGQERTVLQR